jgi:hypothetical protein
MKRTARRQYPGLRIVTPHRAFPHDVQWRPASAGSGSGFPAYSGGTAWESHPLRVVAGRSREAAAPSVSCAASIARALPLPLSSQ